VKVVAARPTLVDIAIRPSAIASEPKFLHIALRSPQLEQKGFCVVLTATTGTSEESAQEYPLLGWKASPYCRWVSTKCSSDGGCQRHVPGRFTAGLSQKLLSTARAAWQLR
jgi:hypothetical protein